MSDEKITIWSKPLDKVASPARIGTADFSMTALELAMAEAIYDRLMSIPSNFRPDKQVTMMCLIAYKNSEQGRRDATLRALLSEPDNYRFFWNIETIIEHLHRATGNLMNGIRIPFPYHT